MKNIEIRHRFTGAILFATEVDDADAFPIRTALCRANLARANLARANLAGANLAHADLADANLADANLAGANLAGANLARANLAGADLADADLADADLADANLAGADLADANLAGANLAGANLARANLAGANLARARNVPSGTEPPEPYVRAATDEAREQRRIARMVDYRARHPEIPVVEHLDSRILAALAEPGNALDMSNWHTCNTTHCRGGWAVSLAGQAGRELEARIGVERAAAAIYRASTGRVPHFFATNARAMEDIRACAAREGAV